MGMPKLLAIFVTIACAGVLGASARAEACQCSPPTPDVARRESKLIFEGRVDADEPRPGEPSLRQATFSDVVVHRGGGVGASRVTVMNGNDCMPVQLDAGKRYLVYMREATLTEPGAGITFCERVVLSSAAADELRELAREGSMKAKSAPSAAPAPVPEPGASPTPAPPHSEAAIPRSAPGNAGGCASCSAAGAAYSGAFSGALAALLGLASVLRRELRKRDRKRAP
jgi:hypothetical protein